MPSSIIRIWLRRLLLSLLAFVLLAAATGAIYQAIGNRRDAQRYPQRGRSILAAGIKFNLNRTGTGRPVVILENGLGLSSIGWIVVQPKIAEYTRVCSYDRAGYGWSEQANGPRTSLHIAKELKALLDTAGEKAPYILIGPSFGGFNVRVFPGLYPAQVAGVVLVDASHEDQQTRIDQIVPKAVRDQRLRTEKQRAKNERLHRFIDPVMLHFGIERLQAALHPDPSPPSFGLSAQVMEEFDYLDQQLKTRETIAAEDAAFRESGNQARSAGSLGNRPLVVLTGGKMELTPDPLLSNQMQDELRNLWINVLQVEEATFQRAANRSS